MPPEPTVAIRLLGPLEVEVAGVRVVLQRRRERSLLAVLALEAGRPVSADHLLELVWGEDAKSAERSVLHTTVSRLRAALTAGGAQRRAAPLERRAGGYQLSIDRRCVDALHFHDLLERARRETAPRHRADLLREALRLWRGAAGADADLERIRHLLLPFEERRVRAIEECAEIDLELGRPAAVVPELVDLVAADPRREAPRRLLMLALYRSGRRIEALEVYRDFTRRLADEFGLDPSAELQQLHQAILREDPSLAAASSAGRSRQGAVGGLSRSDGPRHLPPALPTFAGRRVVLAELRLLLSADRLATQPALVACHGVAGVGKSTVMIKAAHEAAELFPDGQLYVDLHGASPGLPPVEPIEVLARLLRALGMAAAQVPTTVDEAAGTLRSMLATRRVLIVADNAADAAQVRPLMPASPGSALLVTSRVMLAALDGATLLAVDVMSRDEALALLRRLCGHERIGAEPAHATTLIDLCDHLPLALRIVGARLASRPGWSLGALVEQLGDERRRLDELAIDDLAVRISMQSTYRAVKRVSPEAARLFRRLSLVTVPEVTPQIAEDLLDAPGDRARAALAGLAGSHLIEPSTSDRYRVHDLLRLFAAERVQAEDSTHDRDAAILRVFDRYLGLLRRACSTVRPVPRWEHRADDGRTGSALAERAEAMAWLESERANLTALVAQAVDRAGPEAPSFARFALTVERELSMFLNMGGYRRDMEVLGALASTAAERIGDMSAAAYSLAGLAYAQLATNKGDEAQATATRSLAFARAAADPSEEANSLGVLAAIQYKQGDAELALASLDQAARLSRENESPFGEAIALHNMAEVLVTLGRLADAQQHLERCLAIRQSIADRVGEVLTMASLGRLHITTGDYIAAEKALGRALDGCRETGYREEEWRVLICLSEVDARQANVERALGWAEEALLVAIRSDNAYGQMLSLRASARALHVLGRIPQATAYTRRAEQIFIDDKPPADKEIEALLTGSR